MNFYSHPTKSGGYIAINLDKIRTVTIFEDRGAWELRFWIDAEDYLSREFKTKEEALDEFNRILSL